MSNLMFEKEITTKEKNFREWVYTSATEKNKIFLNALWNGRFDELLSTNIFRIVILYIVEPMVFIFLYYLNSSKELREYLFLPKIVLYTEIIYFTIISLGIMIFFANMQKMDLSKATIYYREISPKTILRIDTVIRVMIITALFAIGSKILSTIFLLSLILLEIANYSIPSQLYRIAKTDFIIEEEK